LGAACYPRKLNTDPKRYKTTERNRELLSAIEVCNKYYNILPVYHQPIIAFTDHKENTFNGLKAPDRVLHCAVADGLPDNYIDSLNIQEQTEEGFTLLFRSDAFLSSQSVL
jgi:hypothetical protein